MDITLRLLKARDIPLIFSSLSSGARMIRQPIYERYLNEQTKGERVVIVAFLDGDFVGHVTIIWHPGYPPFAEKNIPEISDIQVRLEFRRRGIGSAYLWRRLKSGYLNDLMLQGSVLGYLQTTGLHSVCLSNEVTYRMDWGCSVTVSISGNFQRFK